MELRRLLPQPERLGVVHHWDVDGVASAALAWRLLGRPSWLSVPRIGFYSASAIPEPPASVDALLVLDYGIPGAEYVKLRRALRVPLIVVVDHHRVQPPQPVEGLYYINPVAAGEVDEDDAPACSFLLYRLLGSPGGVEERVTAALGIAGDLGPYIDAGKPHPGLERARQLLRGTGWSLERLRELAELVDSCYRIVDTECIRFAVETLATRGPEALASSPRLREAEKKAKSMIEDALKRLEPIPAPRGVLAYRLEYDGYVTGAIGRILASRNPDGVAVLVHTIPSQGGGFIYIRSVSTPVTPLREELARRGWRSGGKKSVAVLEYQGPQPPPEMLRDVLEAAAHLLDGGQ